MDEWGQISTLALLTRYARTQFENPDGKAEPDLYNESKFYSDDENEDPKAAKARATKAKNEKIVDSIKEMDADHRKLLENCKLMLFSRNAGVVVGAVSLMSALAPKAELSICVRPLIRILHNPPEVQVIVLSNIKSLLEASAAAAAAAAVSNLKSSSKEYQDDAFSASMPVKPTDLRELFRPHIRHFFIFHNDTPQCKSLKLDILTELVASANISLLLQEFQSYMLHADRDLVPLVVQAIGKCALKVKEASRQCMRCLLGLLGCKRTVVMAECVVMIRALLCRHTEDRQLVVQFLAR
jgi:AP-3 complex subunit beta